jgi:hypothetical protein
MRRPCDLLISEALFISFKPYWTVGWVRIDWLVTQGLLELKIARRRALDDYFWGAKHHPVHVA